MNRCWMFLLLLCALPLSLNAEDRSLQEGTIVRMRMSDCMGTAHPLMDALSGTKNQPTGTLCPEYVMVTDRVVYLIIAKNPRQIVPLAETTRFHFQNNEVLIRIDDARHESSFRVKEMVLRHDWERSEQLADARASSASTREYESEPRVQSRR